ncbi:armadillo repeat-containing protein 7-like [Glandiceps talaboti]
MNRIHNDLFKFLQQLISEFQKSSSEESKEQVLANLSNFAYDPVNYEYLRKLNIIDLFLDMLEEESEKMVELALGGLSNIAQDEQSKEYILRNDGISMILTKLSSTNEEIVIAVISCLIFLVNKESKSDATSTSVVQRMQQLLQSSNTRISNLAAIFLQDCCCAQDIEVSEAICMPTDIPLPPDQ